jgi:hypothetical protein
MRAHRPGPDRETLEQHLREANALVEQVKPLFAHQRPDVCGAALCELTAMWLAGYVAPGSQRATEKVRADMLQRQMLTVKRLTPVIAQAIGTDALAKQQPS